MAAPYLDQWSPATKIAVHEGFVSFLDGPSGNASITIHRNDDVLLAEIPLTRPCGTVNPTTGLITMTALALEESAPAGGFAAYATLRDSAGVPVRSLGCQAGSVPVINKCVLNNLEITESSRVELVSMEII